MTELKVYTRETTKDQYLNGLAYSVHMALIEEGRETPLHNEYGILFAAASVDERNVLVPHYTGNLKVAELQKQYLITGENWAEDGKCLEDGRNFWSWSTTDFLTFEEWGLLTIEELEEKTGMDRAVLRKKNTVAISEDMAEALKQRWNPITFQELSVLPGEKDRVKVTYSDGSVHEKTLSGYPNLKFPLARGFGDPVILLWKDEYYFIATNDNLDDIGLYVRKAQELDDLFTEDIEMHLILDKDEKRHLIQTFWAPEFHVIGGELYILFAVSNEQWGPQCHMMKLKENGDILKAEDWTDPVKVTRAGGRALGENGITLDMTYVKSGDRHYYVWSYREHIGTPLDSGSMLMVAEFSPEHPQELITEPVCLSRPLYGFENVRGTINNEGPYAFYHNGMIYLAYSGGDARGYLYTVGMLTAKDGDDLCDLAVWEKAKTPVLSFASVPGEYGPGHNSFFCDRNGDWWIAFHAVRCYEEKVISSAIRRVHFDIHDQPRFDLAREEDLPETWRCS